MKSSANSLANDHKWAINGVLGQLHFARVQVSGFATYQACGIGLVNRSAFSVLIRRTNR